MWASGARRPDRRLQTAGRGTAELLVKSGALEMVVASKTASEKDQGEDSGPAAAGWEDEWSW